MMRKLFLYSLAFIIPFVMVSCGGGDEGTAVQAKKPVVKPVEKAVVEEKVDDELADLSRVNRRNPFVSYYATQVKKGPVRIKGPLECCELGAFKLMAVVSGVGASRALVQAPDGKRYIVKRGDLMGLKSGKVFSITKGGLKIREPVLDEEGKVVSSTDYELTLPLEGKEKLKK